MSSEAMREIFSDRHFLQCMLDVESALARAQAKLGLIPHDAAAAISAAAGVANIDAAAIEASARVVGYPVVALARQLGAAAGGDAARYVHLGATTQDILDSALVLQIRAGLDLIEGDLEDLALALGEKARTHRLDVMAGRTHLQHAVPITFGYKCALWLGPLLDHLESLRAFRPRVLTVQFGGAAGTLASLGERGRSVTLELARELELGAPEFPWHAARAPLAELACALGVMCGTLGKFATDIVLLMQTEVGEVFEPHERGRGGSSTMPQKRNPIASESIIANMRAVHALVPIMLGAMAGDHERSSGPWQSEGIALPQIFALTGAALAHARAIARGMQVDPARMRRNLDLTRGLIQAEAVSAALSPMLGRSEAHELVERACERAIAGDRPLHEALEADRRVAAQLDRAALEQLLDPANYTGEAVAVVDRVLLRLHDVLGSAHG